LKKKQWAVLSVKTAGQEEGREGKKQVKINKELGTRGRKEGPRKGVWCQWGVYQTRQTKNENPNNKRTEEGLARANKKKKKKGEFSTVPQLLTPRSPLSYYNKEKKILGVGRK